MQTHVRVLGILHIVFGCCTVLIGLVVLMLFGGIAGLVGATDHSGDAAIAVPILGAIGGFVFLFLTVLSIPEIVAGAGLLAHRPWARVLTIIVSIVMLLHFPFGTALGFYGLWVLFSPEGAALFGGPRPQSPPYVR